MKRLPKFEPRSHPPSNNNNNNNNNNNKNSEVLFTPKNLTVFGFFRIALSKQFGKNKILKKPKTKSFKNQTNFQRARPAAALRDLAHRAGKRRLRSFQDGRAEGRARTPGLGQPRVGPAPFTQRKRQDNINHNRSSTY